MDNEWYRKLKKLIPVDKEFVAETIWIGISTGCDPMSGFEEFYPFFFMQPPTMDESQKVMNALMECYAHTNLRSNRGWEPLKLYNRMEKSNGPTTIIPMSSNMADSLREAEDEVKDMGFNVDYDAGFGTFNKVENGKVKKIKAGRNEPCPCGSGKKYKRCHGRNEKVIPQNQMWNTAVVFGPLEGCNIPVEDYYFQGGTEEGIIYIGRKKTSEPVKLNIALGDDEPTKIFVVSDKLYDIVSAMPTMLEQDGFFINVGLYDEDEDILEVNLLRDMRNVR